MADTLHRTGLGSAHTLFLDKIFVAYIREGGVAYSPFLEQLRY